MALERSGYFSQVGICLLNFTTKKHKVYVGILWIIGDSNNERINQTLFFLGRKRLDFATLFQGQIPFFQSLVSTACHKSLIVDPCHTHDASSMGIFQLLLNFESVSVVQHNLTISTYTHNFLTIRTVFYLVDEVGVGFFRTWEFVWWSFIEFKSELITACCQLEWSLRPEWCCGQGCSNCWYLSHISSSVDWDYPTIFVFGWPHNAESLVVGGPVHAFGSCIQSLIVITRDDLITIHIMHQQRTFLIDWSNHIISVGELGSGDQTIMVDIQSGILAKWSQYYCAAVEVEQVGRTSLQKWWLSSDSFRTGRDNSRDLILQFHVI